MPTTVNLFKTLINVGIRPNDAEELEKAYSSEPDFLDGLELIATIIALKEQPGQLPPAGEPWKSIFDTIATETANGATIDDAWQTAIGKFSPELAFSITSAVSLRMKAVLDFEAQKNNRKRFKSKDYIRGLKQLGYSTWRLNECGHVIELNGDPLTDGMVATIRQKMRDAGFYRSVEFEDVYISAAYHHQYHPIREYLTSLTWDGSGYIQKLTEYFTNPDGLFHLWLRKWLIGCCAKVFENGFNPVLVLDGPQGIGKSKFAQWLCPLSKYYHEGAIDPDNKDCRLRLGSVWIWEISELGSTTRRQDIEALKSFISASVIRDRRPYGKYDIVIPAMASLIGTVNNISGIYADPTGSRRFLTCALENIDWHGYTKEIDINQVWAEAMTAYLAKEKWELTPDEIQKSMDMNENYAIEDPVEGILKKYFKVEPNNFISWTPTADILHILEDPYQGALKGTTKSDAMALASVMTRLGCKKVKGYNIRKQWVWGYKGVEVISVLP